MVPHILFGTVQVSFHTAAVDNRKQIKNAHLPVRLKYCAMSFMLNI